jgi:hypothetical protein
LLKIKCIIFVKTTTTNKLLLHNLRENEREKEKERTKKCHFISMKKKEKTKIKMQVEVNNNDLIDDQIEILLSNINNEKINDITKNLILKYDNLTEQLTNPCFYDLETLKKCFNESRQTFLNALISHRNKILSKLNNNQHTIHPSSSYKKFQLKKNIENASDIATFYSDTSRIVNEFDFITKIKYLHLFCQFSELKINGFGHDSTANTQQIKVYI